MYHVEGIGYDFIPTVLEQSSAAVWMKSNDRDSFTHARALIRHEGLCIGGSCGSAMHGAYDYIKQAKLGNDATVVVLFADSTRNYMSKFLDDDWLKSNNFGDFELLSRSGVHANLQPACFHASVFLLQTLTSRWV